MASSRSPVIVVVAAVIMAAAHLASGSGYYPPASAAPFTTSDWKYGTAILLLAARVAGIVPVQFRRVPCQRSGGVRLYVQGNNYWLLLYVMNVAGSGDISDVAVKSAGEPDCSYRPASHNTQGLVVRMTSYSSPRKTIVVNDAIPAWWCTGLSYQGSNNFY